MITHHCKSVSVSLMSADLPIWSVVETPVTLHQKDRNRFHIVLTAPPVTDCEMTNFFNPQSISSQEQSNADVNTSRRILWFEISPKRVVMTMQGNAQMSYRHIWQQGVSGTTYYWLPNDLQQQNSQQPNKPIRLRNFTRHLTVSGHPLPENLSVEYELWVGDLQVGSYVLNLNIKH
ncbi:MAG: hypothetical protein KME46_23420 [Brasilonema angustatum HA4187-MV1]|nr:hypothetical protein [Brasilonema angustatum HA4187-MV1]